MKQVIALVAVLAMGIVASFALAAPPPGKGPNRSTSTSTSTSPGKSGEHGNKAKCRPINLKGTVSGGSIALMVEKASGPQGKALQNTTANLTVSGKVSVQLIGLDAPERPAGCRRRLVPPHLRFGYRC